MGLDLGQAELGAFEARAANLCRWYRPHLLPRPNGWPLGPRLVGNGTDEGSEFAAATEENQVRYIEERAQRGMPYEENWQAEEDTLFALCAGSAEAMARQ